MADIVSPRESRDTYCSSFEHFARSLYVFLYYPSVCWHIFVSTIALQPSMIQSQNLTDVKSK